MLTSLILLNNKHLFIFKWQTDLRRDQFVCIKATGMLSSSLRMVWRMVAQRWLRDPTIDPDHLNADA